MNRIWSAIGDYFEPEEGKGRESERRNNTRPLHIPNNTSRLIIHELDTHLCDTAAGSYAGCTLVKFVFFSKIGTSSFPIIHHNSNTNTKGGTSKQASGSREATGAQICDAKFSLHTSTSEHTSNFHELDGDFWGIHDWISVRFGGKWCPLGGSGLMWSLSAVLWAWSGEIDVRGCDARKFLCGLMEVRFLCGGKLKVVA